MKLLRKLLPAVTLVAFAPSPLFACAACYGKSNSALAQGMNWGIFTLMGIILTVLTCIAVFFVHIVRKEEAGLRQAGTTRQSPEAAQQRGPAMQPGFRESTCDNSVR